MEITYLGHSGFLIEWESYYWLFDYYRGTIPDMDAGKELMVFVSHKHGDHYNPEIYKLYNSHPNIQYVLSSDINLKRENFIRAGITGEIMSRITVVNPSQKYELNDLQDKKIVLKTLKSTDCGVAFLLHYKGRTVYHAGDLNLWVWKEESKQYNNNMKARFDQEMSILKEVPIDIAFAPLDPRQGEWYYLGLEQLLNTARVRYVFPMHFWEQSSVIQQYKQERAMPANDTVIMDILQDGQKWNIE